MVDRQLKIHAVELSMLNESELLAIDETGTTRHIGLDSIVLLIRQHEPYEKPPRDPPWITRQLAMFGEDQPKQNMQKPYQPVLDLVDGQRWVGVPMLEDDNPDTISWAIFKQFIRQVSLESIQSMQLAPVEPSVIESWPGIDDRVILRNNDVLDGFVESVEESVTIETDQKSVSIPVDRLAALLLANPAVEPTGARLLTSKGSVIDIQSVMISPTGRVHIILSENHLFHATTSQAASRETETQTDIETDQATIEQVLFDASAVSGLSQLDIVQITHEPDQLWADEPQIDAGAAFGFGDITLSGPIEVRWTLPRWADRFATTVDLPAANWAWGDCELVVLDEDRHELARVRLNAETPRVRINVPLAGSNSLSLRVESGKSGPIQDTITLRRPLILWK